MKLTLSTILLSAIFLTACGGQNPTASLDSGQQIYFSVRGGTFTYLKVEGNDPNGQWNTSEESTATGLSQVITKEYWKGTIVLVFNVVGAGLQSCVIDNLREAPGSKLAIITYTQGVGCTGESGSARQLGSEQALFDYVEGRDGLKLLGFAGDTVDSAECIKGIIEALADQIPFKIVIACAKATVAVVTSEYENITQFNEVLSKYHLQISDKPFPTATSAPALTSTTTPKLTRTPRPTATKKPNPVSSLRGTVTQLSNCRYGPDWPYLYKYGLRAGTPMEVIGRDADGNWLHVQGVGAHNPCWIKASEMQVDGDVMSLKDAYPVTTGLPISPFFRKITITRNSHSAGSVSVQWLEHTIRSDLKTGEGIEYIVEVWTCVAGKPNFSAIGTNETSASFQIDDSCGMTSHADVIGEDKEGFSPPAMIVVH